MTRSEFLKFAFAEGVKKAMRDTLIKEGRVRKLLGSAAELGEKAIQEGTRGAWGHIPANLAPVALGAGVGYAADGRRGALTGAGIGLGARLGAGGLVRRARELGGMSRLAGKAAPAWEEIATQPVLRNALIGAGTLGAAGGTLGHVAGGLIPERQAPLLGGLGFSPEDMQGMSQMAMPYLSQELGVSPEVLQALGQQYGLVPPQTPTY